MSQPQRIGRESQAGSTIPVKILGFCSVLLVAAILYNSMGGFTPTRGRRTGMIREAAPPLQRRFRKSKYGEEGDPDMPGLVVVEKLQKGPKSALLARIEKRKKAAAKLAKYDLVAALPNAQKPVCHGIMCAVNQSNMTLQPSPDPAFGDNETEILVQAAEDLPSVAAASTVSPNATGAGAGAAGRANSAVVASSSNTSAAA